MAKPTRRRGPNEHDVEIAKAQHKFQLKLPVREGWGKSIPIIAIAAVVAAIGFFVVDPLAGKETIADINVSVGATAAFTLTGFGGLFVYQRRKMRWQADELKRQRDYIDVLEAENKKKSQRIEKLEDKVLGARPEELGPGKSESA